jgi:hypothetical protein
MSVLLRPETKADAYKRIEAILEKAGATGVHRAHFVFDLRWSQAGARISEMNDLGWKISSIALPENQWRDGVRTAYRLDSKPLQAEFHSQSTRTWDDVCRERNEKLERESEFQLTP